jgi:hypothetical protein
MNPLVKIVHSLEDYQLELIFENGERRIFDVKPYLQRGVFARLRNRAVFQAARVVAGSVEWPGELDMSYDTLYLEGMRCPEIASPEELLEEAGN